MSDTCASVDYVDYPALKSAIAAMPALILNGVCLRQVLENLDTDLDGHIYVMHMREGLWADEEDCVFPDGGDAAIEELASRNVELSRHFDEPSHHIGFEQDEDLLQLKFEVMGYHAAFVPHESADLVYERGKHAA